MSNIRCGQLFAILFLSGAWQILCIPSAASGGQLLGVAAAAGLQLILLIPMLGLSRRNFSLSRMISHRKWLGFLYIVCFLLWGAQSFSQLWGTAPRISLPVSGRFTAAVLIVITCLYTCSLGLHALAKSAPFVLGFLLLSLIVLLIGAAPRLDTVRFSPGMTGAWSSGTAYFSLSDELAAAFVLLERVKSGQSRAMTGYLLLKALLACLILFLCICVCGRLGALEDYPFFTLTALSQPLQSQRADALYLIIFVMLFVVRITLQTSVIAHLLRAMFPRLRGAAPLSLAVMVLLSWGMEQIHLTAIPLYGVLLFLTVFLVPLVIFLIRRCSHEQNTPASAASVSPDDDGMQQGCNQ